MSWTPSVILFVLWLLGFVTSYTLGGFIHVLLVLALIVLVVGLFRRRRPGQVCCPRTSFIERRSSSGLLRG
jgi:hypothetical protein